MRATYLILVFGAFVTCTKPNKVTLYYDDGKTIRSIYETVDSKKNGLEQLYSESGLVLAKVNWKDGKKEGQMIEYYLNGSVAVVRQFFKGFQVDKSLYYDENGSLIEIHYFDSTGRFIDFRKFNPKTGERLGEMFVIPWVERDTISFGDTVKVSITLGNVQDFRLTSGVVYIGSEFINDNNGDPKALSDTSQVIFSNVNNYETILVPKLKGPNYVRGVLECQLGRNKGDSIYNFFFESTFTVID